MFLVNQNYIKFHSALLYDQPFQNYSPFLDKYTEWPQNGLDHYKVKDTLPKHVTDVPDWPEAQISPYNQLFFSSYKQFWEKCTDWPQNDLDH